MNFKNLYLLTVIFFMVGLCPMHALNFNGKIVIPEHATPAETTAANDLSSYLTQMGISNIQIITEGNAGSVPAGAIWLGPTQKAANALKKIDDYTPDKAIFNGNPLLNYVSDTEAPSGYAVQLAPGANPGSYYTLPLLSGAYSPSQGLLGACELYAVNIIGPGYHYYKLLDLTPGVNDFYLFFFRDWNLMYPTIGEVVNKYGINVHYAVWASIKFTGPAYPFGNASDPNGIYVEKVFLVRDNSPLSFNSDQANLNGNQLLSVVNATDTESGHAVRLAPGTTPNSYYTMPLQYGTYSPSRSNSLGVSTLPSTSVVGAGYHYYKLMSFNADRDFYFYLFGDWSLQYQMYNLVAENGPGKYSAWARLKFTGPAYPYGISTDPNGIYVDRMILVKDTKLPVTLTPVTSNLNGNPLLSVVTDPDAPSGHAVRLAPGANPNSYYTMPLAYGEYCPSLARSLGSWVLSSGSVVGSGYHDYTLTTFTPDADNFYFYFFGDWTLQFPMANVLITNGPGVSYTVHASIKFTGPAYPYGNANDPNGIYIDNVRLIPVQ